MTEPTRDATSAAADPSAAAGAAGDPTHALFHMSRTAGVGLGDYAAVNVRAVIGLILGIASVLAYIFSDSYLPLAIPLAGIVVSLIALIQIQNSNGTQTGRGIAVAGLLLSGLLGGATIYKQVHTASVEREARIELADLVRRLSDASANKDGPAGYALFASSFHQQVNPDVFTRTLISRGETLFGGAGVGRFELGPNVNFATGSNGQLLGATGLAVIYSKNDTPAAPQRYEVPIEFSNEPGGWKILDVQNYFIQQERPAR